MFVRSFFVFLAFVLLVFVSSCRKDQDEIYPKAVISAPAPGATYYLPDTVFVTAEVSDDQNLDYVKIAVTAGNGVPVSSVYQNSDFALNPTVINTSLVLDNVHLSSGPYFVQVTTGDGTNVRESFVQINLVEVPLQLRSVLLFSQSGGETRVDTLNAGVLHPVALVAGNVASAMAGSYHQEIAIAGLAGAGVSFLSAGDFSLWGNLPVQAGQIQQFVTDFWFSDADRRYYVATQDGLVRAVGRKGQQFASYQPGAGFVPKLVRLFDNNVYIFAENEAAGMKVLFVMNKTSGALIQSAQVNFNIKGMYPLSTSEVLLFVDEGNDWTLKKLTKSNLGLSDVGFVAQEGTIKSSVFLDFSGYAVHSSEGIYLLNSGLNQIQSVAGTSDVIRIRVNRITGQIFALTNSSLKEILPEGMVVELSNFPNSMVDFDLLYNK